MTEKENLLAFVPCEIKKAHIGRWMSNSTKCCLVIQCPDGIWREFWYAPEPRHKHRTVWDAKKAAQNTARQKMRVFDDAEN